MFMPAIIAAECLAMNANNIVGFTVAIGLCCGDGNITARAGVAK